MNRKEKYDNYIKSVRWRQKRLEFISQHPTGRCFCGEYKNLHVHHATYDRLGNERLDDLRLVCHSCHDMIHYYHKNAGIPHTLEQATNDYIKMWLEGNEPKIKTYVTHIPSYYVKKKKKKNKAVKNQAKKQKENREKKKKTKEEICSTKSWEEMSKNEKKLVDFDRYSNERKERLLLSAEGKDWDSLTKAQKRQVDIERFNKEIPIHKTARQIRKEKENAERQAQVIVEEEKKRIANGLMPSRFRNM